MNDHNTHIENMQKSFQQQLQDGSIGKVVKECESAKKEFDKQSNNVKKITEEIQGFIKKFDVVKDEINDRGKQFETYKMEIENKKLQIQLLETEIQNITLKS